MANNQAADGAPAPPVEADTITAKADGAPVAREAQNCTEQMNRQTTDGQAGSVLSLADWLICLWEEGQPPSWPQECLQDWPG